MQQEIHCHPPIWEGSMFSWIRGFSKPSNLGSLCIVGFFPYQGLPGLHLIKTRKIFLKQMWDCHGESVGSRGPPFSGSLFGFGGVIKVHRENGGTLNMGAPIYLHLISWAFIRYPLLKGSLRGFSGGVFESKVVWIIPSKNKILSLVKPLGRQPKTANC